MVHLNQFLLKLAVGILAVINGGTGTSTPPTAGQVLIGKSNGNYTPANITAGANVTITEGDGTLEIGASGASGYTTVEDEGGSLTQRTNINFVGAGVTAADSGGKTVVTIPGGSGGAPDNATYITQTADATLTNEQNLDALASGILRVDTAAGVLTSLTDSAGIAANISDETGSGGALVFSSSPTITTPTIASFTNATHNHQNAAGGGQLDHGLALTGLTDDDHTQYFLLNGRSGGQTATGGTGVGDDLTLLSTSNGTKGNIYLGTASTYDEANDRFGAGTLNPQTRFHSKSTSDADGLRVEVVASSTNNPNITLAKARGTIGAESVISNSDPLGFILFRGFNSSYQDAAWISVRAAEAWGVGAQGTEMRFASTPLGSTSAAESMRLRATGLAVKGNGTLAAPTVSFEAQGTDAILIAKGTTGQEPSPVDGYLRYDTTTGKLRAVQGGAWTDVIGGGGSGLTHPQVMARVSYGY